MSTLSELLRDAERPTASDVPTSPGQLELFAPSASPEGTARARTRIDELRRLEESIRWLQEEARSLPQAANLAPVPGLPPPEDLDLDEPFDRNPSMTEREAVAAALAPERIAPRLVLNRRTSLLQGTMKIAVAGAIAAGVLVYVSDYRDATQGTQQSTSVGRMFAAADDPAVVPAPSMPRIVGPDAPEASTMRADREAAPGVADDNSQRDLLAAAGGMSFVAKKGEAAGSKAGEPREPAVTVQPEPAPESAAPSAPRRAAMAPAEIAAIIQRGRAHFQAGDLAAARLLFRRAANAGDADAAIAMGTTYDPAVLAEHKVRGVNADVDAARAWYERARQLGSPEGPNRIDMLAHR